MNKNHIPSDKKIRSVLETRATKQDITEVVEWFSTEDGVKWLDDDMSFFVDRLNHNTINLDNDFREDIVMNRIFSLIRKKQIKRNFTFAAAIIIPCVLIISAWFSIDSRIEGSVFSQAIIQEISAEQGERKEVIFQDGSRVFLNAGTKLSYPDKFSLTERRVTLDGEAYFEITKNPKRPFIVEMGKTKIKVLGTEFNVKAYSKDPTIDILLVNGSIEFSTQNNSYLMSPAENLVCNRSTNKISVYRNANTQTASAWTDNIILFNDSSLEELTSTLSRWYKINFTIQVEDPSLYSFSLQTPYIPLNELLKELENISTLKFIKENNNIIIKN